MLVSLPVVRPLWTKEFISLHIPEFSCVGCTVSTRLAREEHVKDSSPDNCGAVLGIVEGYASSHNSSIDDVRTRSR